MLEINMNFTAVLKKTRYQTLEDFEKISERIRAALRAERLVIKQTNPTQVEIRALFNDPLKDGYTKSEFLEDLAREHDMSNLPFAVDELGNKVPLNLNLSPHALLGGTSGSGKSVGLNALLASLTTVKHPMNLHLVDPKAVELRPWAPLAAAHATTEESMTSVVQYVQSLMKERYEKMESMGIRNLASNPEALEELGGTHVLIVDELAEFLAVCGKDGGQALSSIAQLGRAAQVFIIIATQNPKAELFSKTTGTETLRSNLSNLVAFRVLRRADSEVILGSGSASDEGKDSSTISPEIPGTAYTSFSPERLRVPYLSDEDIETFVQQHRKETTHEE